MAHTPEPIVYVRLRKRARVPAASPVRIGDVASLSAGDAAIEEQLRNLIVYRPAEQDGQLVLIDMMRLVAVMRGAYPNLRPELYGEPHSLVELADRPRKPNYAWLSVMWVMLFFGSGLAIMNFHEDVSMPEVHARIYKLVTGRDEAHPYLLQIPYSIGLGAGMIVFFNQLFKKKFSEEPSPLEVEMYGYEQSMDQYIVSEEYKRMDDRRPRP
ncbi:stage V sporulation protein AA [Paenibacillus thermoaerophilus]|uniref:Stage V sporulation protein AA n=1 Tax=Paenibacillus thermoaerophilus TaxID=1215385 RepID=A0ABW2V3J3_9BACL|nr:stage V sporulation protein AA [Paenibacillus thermoaerophilus]TMV12036.1 stage V sporulation protein AA [Paenibacillus thermoaerophilus]